MQLNLDKLPKRFPSNGLKMVELFCGAGIGTVGFRYAGYEIIQALDNVDWAVRTYNLNHGNHATVADIRKTTAEQLLDCDIITGGFPCTSYSVGGAMRGKHDPKVGDLGYHFFRLIAEKQPKAFLAENVSGITGKKNIDTFNELVESIEQAGYNVTWKLTDCWEYGVPQKRNRVFIVGIRKDLGLTYEFPEPIPMEQRTTLRDAIFDLPHDPLSNHNILNHNWYYGINVPVETRFSSRYLSANRQRQWDEPSYCIVSTARQLPLYPEPPNFDIRKLTEEDREPPRRFTVRECLRIQTVPDWFYFPSDIKPEHQHMRCSGIPPVVSYKLSKQLANLLTSVK